MFQTVPDTSSYVKVRHDSIFKQVMSKIPTLPNSQSFVFNFLLNLAGKKIIPRSWVGEGPETGISNLFWKWKYQIYCFGDVQGWVRSCIIGDKQWIRVGLSFLLHWCWVCWVILCSGWNKFQCGSGLLLWNPHNPGAVLQSYSPEWILRVISQSSLPKFCFLGFPSHFLLSQPLLVLNQR